MQVGSGGARVCNQDLQALELLSPGTMLRLLLTADI